MQLFCFTCAGGTIDLFTNIKKELDKDINVIPLEYAGHGRRNREPFSENIEQLAENMFSLMQEKGDLSKSYAIMGYSMGCIVALSVYELIIKNNCSKPQNLFLAAHPPNSNLKYLQFKNIGMEEKVKEHILMFGGISKKIQNNSAFWRVYLPIYQSDFYVIGTYDFECRKPIVDVPTIIFYSETDTPYSNMVRWKDYIINTCEFICYEGNHFFIHEHYRNMATIIKERLLNH